MTKKITLVVKKTCQQLLDHTEQKCVKSPISALFKDDFKRTQVIFTSSTQSPLICCSQSFRRVCVCVLAQPLLGLDCVTEVGQKCACGDNFTLSGHYKGAHAALVKTQTALHCCPQTHTHMGAYIHISLVCADAYLHHLAQQQCCFGLLPWLGSSSCFGLNRLGDVGVVRKGLKSRHGGGRGQG